VNPGFTPQQLTAFPITLPTTRYARPERQAEFFRQLLEQARTVPGVQAAGMVSFLPLSGGRRLSYFCPEGQICQGLGKDPLIAFWQVSDGYFESVKTPLLRGRVFTRSDVAGGLPVAIISEAGAQRFWPNQNPLGKHIVGSRDHIAREVVGVVSDVKFSALNAADTEQMYLPFEQLPYPAMSLVVRSTVKLDALIPMVRGKIAQLDPTLAVANVSTMEEIVRTSIAQPRLITELVSMFAAFALLLAAIGIYGVMAYSVTARTREMGIRMSLGASRQDIFRLVVGQGARLTLAGVILWLLGAFALARLIATLLSGVRATDPRAFTLAAAILFVTSLGACYIPARRAIRVDPMVALRYE